MSCYAIASAGSHGLATLSLGPEFTTPRGISVTDPAVGLQSIRVVSWNIDCGKEFDVVEAGLERERADLCLLQEVDWNTARTGERDLGAELAKHLHLNLLYGVEFGKLSQERGQRAFIGHATLTRLPARRSRILRFQTQSGFWSPHSWIPNSIPLMQRRLGSRISLVTELEFHDGLLVVYNVHLESRSLGKLQEEQLDEILADLERYPPNAAVILGGDLNSKYFPSVYLRKLELHGFHSATGERIERTHMIAMALDWIFARGPLRIGSGRVCKGDKGSDHYPIYAELFAR